MRLISSKESVARGEVSLLAIIETVTAMVLVFYLSAHFKSLRWLASAICIAPTLLLRTERSVSLGTTWFVWCRQRTSRFERTVSPVGPLPTTPSGGAMFYMTFGPLVRVLSLLLTATLVRVGATIWATISHPWMTLIAVPTNWARVVLATDTLTPLELLPGLSVLDSLKETEDNEPASPPPQTGPPLTRTQTVFDACAAAPLVSYILLVISPLFLPAIVYRWALKATSIVYAPLVFVAQSTFHTSTDLRTKLELIRRGDLSRIRVAYGILAILLFLVKLVLMQKLDGFTNWWQGHPVSRFLAIYVAPAEIPKWQIAELANSLLAVGAMLLARHTLLRAELGLPWPENPIRRLLGFTSGLRWLLALYAIVCVGYITLQAAKHWHWPALGTKWLPWW